MRRRSTGLIAALLGLAALLLSSAAALGAGTRVRVSPGRGGIHTHFVLRFSIPDATGATGAVNVSDSLSITGPRRKGCVGSAEIPLRAAAAGTAFKITLNPSHLNGHWCTGTFMGTLLERRTMICRPLPVREQIVCPDYVIAPRVLARFAFRVTQPNKGHNGR